jgi:hypothetical protein
VVADGVVADGVVAHGVVADGVVANIKSSYGLHRRVIAAGYRLAAGFCGCLADPRRARHR